MKVLINKRTEIKANIDGAETALTFSDLVKMICNTIPQGGYKMSDIRTRITIDSAFDGKTIDQEVEFETADAVYLQNAVKSMGWPFRHKDLLSFIEDIEQMPDKKSNS